MVTTKDETYDTINGDSGKGCPFFDTAGREQKSLLLHHELSSTEVRKDGTKVIKGTLIGAGLIIWGYSFWSTESK